MAFLNNNQIPTLYHFNDDSHEVHIRNEHHLPTAQSVAKEFVQNPNHPRFQQAAWETGAPASLQSKSSLTSITKQIDQLRFSPITALILFVSLLVHLIIYGLGVSELSTALKIQSVAGLYANGEYWRLITPALLHSSAFHIVFNLLWWWKLGKDIEKIFGSLFLLSIFIISAFVSNYAQFLVSGQNLGGLSGVVYAVFGFVWWIGWLKPDLGLSIPKPVIGFMLVWLVLGYADILWVSMANTAHSVGLVTGCILARLIIWYLDIRAKKS